MLTERVIKRIQYLGTTYSCVAVWKDDEVVIIPNENGRRRLSVRRYCIQESQSSCCIVGLAAYLFQLQKYNLVVRI